MNKNTQLILGLWLILTLFNLTKAVHMDDAFHLEAALNLLQNPLRPMSGKINWALSPVLMSESNHPPLFFYYLAILVGFFGENILVLHIFQSVFTFLALYFFNKILFFFESKNHNYVLVFFASCPAFIINQNLMTDVPILSLTLGSCYFILKAKSEKSLRNYVLASLLISSALLIKYSTLPLVVVLIAAIIVQKVYKNLLVLAIPIAFLGLWSLWNIAEFGHIHLFSRKTTSDDPKLYLSFLSCIGAMFVFVFAYVSGFFKNRVVDKTILFVLSALVLFPFALYQVGFKENLLSNTLDTIFIFLGLLDFAFLFYVLWQQVKIQKFYFLQSNLFVIALYFMGLALFFLLFAPFMATRHLLLFLPFAMIICLPLLDKAHDLVLKCTLFFAVLYGIVLANSDYQYANYYKKMSEKVDLPKNKTIWYTGHWGWQYYARVQGWQQYHSEISKPKHGDYIIRPEGIANQYIPEDIKTTVVAVLEKEADFNTFVSGNNFASLYNNFPTKPAWDFSKAPIAKIMIYKVLIYSKEVKEEIEAIKLNPDSFTAIKMIAQKEHLDLDSALHRQALMNLSIKKR